MIAPSHHIPILLDPIVESMREVFEKSSERAFMMDCTLGGGGHTRGLLERLPERHAVISVDQDPEAIARARETFKKELSAGRLHLVHSRFGSIQKSDLEPITQGAPLLGLMADLGFSSDQLDDPERGLSFLKDGPLDMRLDPTQGVSARDYLYRVSENELVEILSEYGEEKFSKRIAASIIGARRKEGIPSTTLGLAQLITQAVPPPARHGRIHAATRTFQALRIAVNEELQELDRLLERVILNVQVGGRVAIISFHSLEDRKVKTAFKDRDGVFEPLTKKPVEPDEEEIRLNSRSRSAKLRIAERVR